MFGQLILISNNLLNSPIPEPIEVNKGINEKRPALPLTTITNLIPKALTCFLYSVSVLFRLNNSEYLALKNK